MSLNIKALKKLTDLGNGFGFLGHEIRSGNHFVDMLTADEMENDDMLHHKVASVVDQAFISAMKGEPLYEVMAYADSKPGRHDSDAASDIIFRHKGTIANDLQQIKEELIAHYRKQFEAFKKNDLPKFPEDVLEKYKEKVEELNVPRDAKADVSKEVLDKLVEELNKVSMMIKFVVNSFGELGWHIRTNSDFFLDLKANLPLSEMGVNYIKDALAKIDDSYAIKDNAGALSVVPKSAMSDVEADGPLQYEDLAPYAEEVVIVPSTEEQIAITDETMDAPLPPEIQNCLDIFTQAGISVANGQIAKADLLRAHSALRIAASEKANLQQFYVAPSQKKFLNSYSNIDKVLDFLTNMEQALGCDITYEDDGYFNIYDLGVDVEKFEQALDALIEGKAVAHQNEFEVKCTKSIIQDHDEIEAIPKGTIICKKGTLGTMKVFDDYVEVHIEGGYLGFGHDFHYDSETQADEYWEHTSTTNATEKHGLVDGKIYWHGEELQDNSEDMFNGYYRESKPYVDADDIIYNYTDQNGGESPWYYSMREDEMKRF